MSNGSSSSGIRGTSLGVPVSQICQSRVHDKGRDSARLLEWNEEKTALISTSIFFT